VREHLDLERILRLARQAPALPGTGIRRAVPERIRSGDGPEHGEFSARDVSALPSAPVSEGKAGRIRPVRVPPRIGYVRDAALWFYYEENLQALRLAGAELVRLSLAQGRDWPELDGLYLGGGFPEECAVDLAPGLERLRDYAENGLPVYAECGGFLLLTQSLERGDAGRPMAGIFPVRARFYDRQQGLGYVEAEVMRPNPFHPVGIVLRGHEFHYTRCEFVPGARPEAALRLRCGKGMGEGVDGFIHKSVFAAYTHIFAPAAPHWAERFVAAVQRVKAFPGCAFIMAFSIYLMI
jgi:cobyrinic acid a,c-diamide synthase